MVRKNISSDSYGSSYNYMAKQVVEAGCNEAVVPRSGENDKLKDKLCYGGGSKDAEMLSSWPPRLYTCSFCKRRFKSAQALGGHMNVHRRARAILRSQSMSPISSPSSSPWLSNSITCADNPFQHEEHHFNYPSPYPNPHWPLYTHHPTIHPSPSNISHLSMLNLTSSCSLVTTTHKNSIPAACNSKHMLHAQAQYHHAELTNRERVKKNCIRAENQLKGLCSRTRVVHQVDMVSRLSIGTGLITSRPATEEDINLELRLGL